ncbi:hypothetical protein VTL71DRAFT_10450 [Oculimacula yallundae]|uniref:Uncharacterized protein n=1 Tax=Oculimacula yallundae TaxID=86028 RepID=A0ABR4CVC1_9HELO
MALGDFPHASYISRLGRFLSWFLLSQLHLENLIIITNGCSLLGAAAVIPMFWGQFVKMVENDGSMTWRGSKAKVGDENAVRGAYEFNGLG